MTKHIPGVERKKIWEKKWVRECIFSLPPIGTALLGVWKLHAQRIADPYFLWASFFIITWLFLGSLVKIGSAAEDDAKNESEVVHEGVYASISTLRAVVSHFCAEQGFHDDIRATFHRVVPPLDNPLTIEQIIPYVGSQDDGMGRCFSINTGITGQAIRRKSPITISSIAGDETGYRAELVAGWGYTEPQARALRPSRISGVAIPVLDMT